MRRVVSRGPRVPTGLGISLASAAELGCGDENTYPLSHYKSRYYSGEMGRFVQPDSLTPGLTDPQGMNRYA